MKGPIRIFKYKYFIPACNIIQHKVLFVIQSGAIIERFSVGHDEIVGYGFKGILTEIGSY